MFDRIPLPLKRRLQALLVDSGLIATYERRVGFLSDAGLDPLTRDLPMEAEAALFAGALVRRCEQVGSPPSLGGRHAVLLLADALQEQVAGQPDGIALLVDIRALFPGSDAGAVRALPSAELRVLFVAANPSRWGKLSLEKEFALVRSARDAAVARDPRLTIDLELAENVRNDQINGLIGELRPHILHFAGHGDLIRESNPSAPRPGSWRGLYVVDEAGKPAARLLGDDEAKPSGIVLETESRQAMLLPDRVLVEIFSRHEINRHIRLVLLNACWAEGQAGLLVHRAAVPFAIGMKQPVDDAAAVRFAEGFYQSLFRRDSMQSAFDSGRAQMLAVVGAGHDHVPTLDTRAGLIASTYQIFDAL